MGNKLISTYVQHLLPIKGKLYKIPNINKSVKSILIPNIQILWLHVPQDTTLTVMPIHEAHIPVPFTNAIFCS